MGMVVNKKNLSKIVGYSERSLTEFQKQGMPIKVDSGRGASNQYDSAEVVRWLIERAVNGKQESAKERLDRLRGDREELAHAADLKMLVPAAEVEAAITSRVMAARSTLTQRDAILKSEIDALYGIDLDIELLNEHTRQALTQLSGDDGDTGDGAGSSVPEVCAPAEDRQ